MEAALCVSCRSSIGDNELLHSAEGLLAGHFLRACCIYSDIAGDHSGSAPSFLAGYFSIVLIELCLFMVAKAVPNLIYANFIWPLTSYNAINAAPYGYTLFEIQ